MSVEMISNVTGYLEDAYLLFIVEGFSLNVSERKTNPKKVYAVDHSTALAMSGSLTGDHGKILENMVFIHLRRQTDRIFYGRTDEGYEIDFITLERGQQIEEDSPVKLYHPCYEMEEEGTLEREIRALQSGMKQYHIKESVIVTEETEDEKITEEGTIRMIPAWKFLLSE